MHELIPGTWPLSVIRLNLTGNGIAYVRPNALKNLPNLKHLDLTHNRLSKIGPGHFQDLTALDTLALQSNRITEIPPGTFNANPYLQHLNLAGNNLQHLSDNVFRGPDGDAGLNENVVQPNVILNDNPLVPDHDLCWIKRAEHHNGWVVGIAPGYQEYINEICN